MNGLENQDNLIGFIVFNILALFSLLSALEWPRIGRIFFFLLFGWACWMNWTYSQNDPGIYQEYADLAVIDGYKDFIQGWFSRHTPLMVGGIATCQGLIAFSMLMKGWIYKLGCIGGITFLLAITPLGVGSGFPCTLIFAIALINLFKKGKDYVWAGSWKGLGTVH